MQSLSRNQIEALLKSEADDLQIAKTIAMQSKPDQTKTLVGGVMLALLANVVVPGLGPIIVLALTADSFLQQRRKADEVSHKIERGEVWEFIPESDRAHFATLDPERKAIEVAAKPVASAQDKPAAIGSRLKIGASIGDAVMAMLRCSMICAPPRCGKGVATVVVMLAFKQAFPAGWIGSCTIKQYQGEHWYWQWSNRHINPNTGRNLDGTYADKVAAAKLIYSIYREWESQPSSKAAPALLVIDELVDTLGHLSEVECGQVAAELPKDKTFADWLRSDLITSATLNQCHHRYLLLVSPVNTASGMGFKNASSLTSYASFVLASREDASFTPSAGGSIFAAPAIPDNLDWDDWYAVAYSGKKKDWFGIPAIPAAEMAAEESKWASRVYEGSKWAASAKLNATYSVITDGVTNEAIKVSIQPDPPAEAVSVPEDDDFQEVLDHALDVIGMTNTPITLTRICPMSRARARHRDRLIETLAAMPEISYYTRPRGNVIQHFFEQKKEGEEDESFVDQLLVDDDEQV